MPRLTWYGVAVPALFATITTCLRVPGGPCTPPVQAATPAVTIRNSGFETLPSSADWQVVVYGAQPQIELDHVQFKQGAASLRITSAQPTDTALGQEIRLVPHKWYRLAGWVRTQNLNPNGAGAAGALQVQRPGGAGVLASTPNHTGTTPWQHTAAVFQTPADGRVRIAVFFVGFGKGTGSAWFDALSIHPLEPARSPLRITNQPLNGGHISPFQVGQFIEYLCDLVPSMWAEKLYDGSFEGLTPYKFEYLRSTDFKEHPWVPFGATNRAAFTLDNSSAISGAVSQKIAVEGAEPCTVGIAQGGISVRRGKPLRFSVYLRKLAIKGFVQVKLFTEAGVVAQCTLQPQASWRKCQSRLVPTASSNDATLSITFRGPGTLWLDSASLMPVDTIGGWRPDLVEALRALKPGVIRFGGSTLDDANLGEFNWQDTVGDPDKRRPFRAWGGLQQTGAGLEEIVQLCRYVNAEPLICVRYHRRTPQDAADQVEYFNGAVTTPMGKLRAANGHPAPYNIRLWQVGNEIGDADYARRLPAFCKAMKQVDPRIELLSSFPTSEVVKKAGALLSYICPHQYGCADLPAMQSELTSLRTLIAENGLTGKLKVAVTEWNTTAGDVGPRRAMLWSLSNALACARYQNLLHRECDLVEIANRSNLANSFCSGIIQSNNHTLYGTPTYYGQQLYAQFAGTVPLKIKGDLPADSAPDVSATLSRHGRVLTLFAVNSSLAPISRPIDLSAFHLAKSSVEVYTLTDRQSAGEPDVANSFTDPRRITPVQSSVRVNGSTLNYNFSPLSITVLRFRTVR